MIPVEWESEWQHGNEARFGGLPLGMLDQLRLYVHQRKRPYSECLVAALENDFVKAGVLSGLSQSPHLGPLAGVIFNEIPKACWGSPHHVEHWLKGALVNECMLSAREIRDIEKKP